MRDRVVIRIKTPQQVTFLALVRSIEDFREELATKGSVSAYQPIKRGYSRAYLTQAGIAYFWEQSQEVFSDSVYEKFESAVLDYESQSLS